MTPSLLASIDPFRRTRRRRPATGAEDATPHARLRLRDYFSLRPYGRNLITPAVSAWLGSAWVVILLMASIEGFVWGAVGGSLVPSASPWLRPPVMAFMFALMFAVVWIVDASLIMSERPGLRARPLGSETSRGIGASLRWFGGLLARLGIVAISLYVTAPFIEKLIRADDIERYHQAQVELYFQQRDAALQARIEARAEQIDAGLQARGDALRQELAQLSESLATEQERRTRIEAEYAPEIKVLSRDLAEVRARVGDEVLGRDGRPEGYGPEARKWDARASLLEQELAEVQAERDARLADIQVVISLQQQRIAERSDALQALQREQQQLYERIRAEVSAGQPPASPPRLTFAARSQALDALRNSPEETGVPHFETVEGFAQAALGILFFALIALKLFEPAAVHAYFSEQIQFKYRKYLAGGLADVPGFAHHDDPRRRLSPAEFHRLWERYERDPDAYFEQIRAVVDAEARVRRLLADQAYEQELLDRRREDIDARLDQERRRRDLELKARERELDLELEETRKRLAGETAAELERLAQQRAEARQTHELALEELQQQHAAERERLEQELVRARQQWRQEQAVAEDALDRQRRAFEAQLENEREQLRLRRKALDERCRQQDLKQQRLSRDEAQAQQRDERQWRIDQIRDLIAEQRQTRERQHTALSEQRLRLARCEAALADAETERERISQRLAQQQEPIQTLQQRIQEAEAQTPAGHSWLAGSDPARRTRRNAARRLAQLERERDQLRQRHAELRDAVARYKAERRALEQDVEQARQEDAAGEHQLAHYQQQLDALLLATY
ncbi:hypothetical protein F2Q65_03585 [Thiohalocapsa marina]|uniref:DUF4407 domain-containing protein n=2 Tax=Thiohalocapsa marina TaxID=424902 RepID=A0A5M8FT56_9GAMM|nr:hypothetical protein F2Q65_03585 [Thiohalocapsa marina]